MSTPRHRIVSLKSTGSTNKDALRLALAGEALPLWVSAEQQTDGRGRSGRTWASEPGNLQASLAVVCHAPLSQAGELALIAGIALFDAVRSISPLAGNLPLRLKWPNDLLVGTAKTGGILVESTTARGEPGFLAVIGFGLNVASHPEIDGRSVTSLAYQGVESSAEHVLSYLSEAMETWLDVWDHGLRFESDIVPAWRERSGAEGERIAVTTSDGRIDGIYRGIDARGYLLVETADGAVLTITHGDVALVSAAEGSRG
jgi:BirA family biotin operon repressor/biotin-[acetyl-CoA-carboxylase] ligase